MVVNDPSFSRFNGFKKSTDWFTSRSSINFRTSVSPLDSASSISAAALQLVLINSWELIDKQWRNKFVDILYIILIFFDSQYGSISGCNEFVPSDKSLRIHIRACALYEAVCVHCCTAPWLVLKPKNNQRTLNWKSYLIFNSKKISYIRQ